MLCYYFEEPTYLFFASDLPGLLYYSHLPAAILSLLVGFFVFFNNRTSLLNKLLFLICLSFSALIFINLIAWTNIHSDIILFSWSFYGILSGLISILSIYFIYVFLHKKDVSNGVKSVFLLLLLPVIIFAPSNLSLTGFNIADCDAFGYEGNAYKVYYTLLGILAMIWIFVISIKKYLVSDSSFRKQILLMLSGIQFFIFTFFVGFFLATYLATIDVYPDSRLEFYGLFGMIVFMVFIGILMVKFKTFNVGMVASNALVVAVILLVASQYTYAENVTAIVLTSITLVLTGIVGIILMRSVRKEIEGRVKIEGLAKSLERANKRLKELDKLKSEFVSIASHQLRSPLTSIRGYASLLLEGSFGELPKKAIEPLERIDSSSKLMAVAVEDYLNVSRIESGNMKYNLSDFNLKDEVDTICDDVRPVAIKQGLTLLFRTSIQSRGVVNADIGKTVQIVHNLINNSIKYTPTGSVTVRVRDDIKKKKIYVEIEDTGIGMSEETISKLFGKFERAHNANSVNTSGTGLGLFVALKMANAMGGDIIATSEGEGKGSRFTFELPLAM